MKPARLIVVATILSFALLASGGLAANAQEPTSSTTQDNLLTTQTYTPAERATALAHWTPARMEALGPSLSKEKTGPLTRPWIGNPIAPVGTLFFTNRDGQDGWCSASSVGGHNRDEVLAAGHCAWLPGFGPASDAQSRNMVFVPGYSNGHAPAGVFPVRASVVSNDWFSGQTTDIAAFAVDKSSVTGSHLMNSVGKENVSFGGPYQGPIRILGYPASTSQNGEVLMTATGFSTIASGYPNDIQLVCDMVEGTSGGPWLKDFNPVTGTGTIVAVFSAIDPYSQPPGCVGAVLDSVVARAIYNRAGTL